MQIQGYAPTDTVKAYAAEYVKYDNHRHEGALAEHVALKRNVSELQQQVIAQGGRKEN